MNGTFPAFAYVQRAEGERNISSFRVDENVCEVFFLTLWKEYTYTMSQEFDDSVDNFV